MSSAAPGPRLLIIAACLLTGACRGERAHRPELSMEEDTIVRTATAPDSHTTRLGEPGTSDTGAAPRMLMDDDSGTAARPADSTRRSPRPVPAEPAIR